MAERLGEGNPSPNTLLLDIGFFFSELVLICLLMSLLVESSWFTSTWMPSFYNIKDFYLAFSSSSLFFFLSSIRFRMRYLRSSSSSLRFFSSCAYLWRSSFISCCKILYGSTWSLSISFDIRKSLCLRCSFMFSLSCKGKFFCMFGETY